jgi:threonine dehydrogenase-like Zn-dependent dehydrogenase
VLKAGICATDLEILRGYMGFEGVPGHEFVGVAESGSFAGRRVVGEINAACRACDTCQRGLERHCPHRTVLGILGRDGAFAEFLALPEANLHPVPDAVSDDHAVFVEPLAAAFAILEQTSVVPGMPTLVLGDGRLGCLCAMVLTNAGASVVHAGRNPNKLAITSAAGAKPLLLERGKKLPKSTGKFPLVVDATGDAAAFGHALEAVEPRGRLILKTTTNDPPTSSLAPIVIDEISIVGSRCGRFEPALDALSSGRIDPAPLIHGRFPLEDAAAAFEAATRRGALKILFDVATR